MINYFMNNMTNDQLTINVFIIIVSFCFHNQSLNYFRSMYQKSLKEEINHKVANSLLFRYCFTQVFLGIFLFLDVTVKLPMGYLFGIFFASIGQAFKSLSDKTLFPLMYSFSIMFIYLQAIYKACDIYHIAF